MDAAVRMLILPPHLEVSPSDSPVHIKQEDNQYPYPELPTLTQGSIRQVLIGEAHLRAVT